MKLAPRSGALPLTHELLRLLPELMNERLPFRTYGSISFYDGQMTSIRMTPLAGRADDCADGDVRMFVFARRLAGRAQNLRIGEAEQHRSEKNSAPFAVNLTLQSFQALI